MMLLLFSSLGLPYIVLTQTSVGSHSLFAASKISALSSRGFPLPGSRRRTSSISLPIEDWAWKSFVERLPQSYSRRYKMCEPSINTRCSSFPVVLLLLLVVCSSIQTAVRVCGDSPPGRAGYGPSRREAQHQRGVGRARECLVPGER